MKINKIQISHNTHVDLWFLHKNTNQFKDKIVCLLSTNAEAFVKCGLITHERGCILEELLVWVEGLMVVIWL